MSIIIKSDREIAVMRQAGRIVGEVLEVLRENVKPGLTTEELDQIAEREIISRGGTPSFKGYHGFPAAICASINSEIVHGIPGKRVLKEGDIISIDLGVIYDGYQGDAAITVPVGQVTDEVKKLLEATEGALLAGIEQAKHGARLGDISEAVQKHAESRGFSVVREYTGHGIGRDMHEDPQIPNYGRRKTGPILKRGMALAIEPMVNIGTWRTKVGDDCWTVYTADGSLSAHFEHTIAITDGGAEILTKSDRAGKVKI